MAFFSKILRKPKGAIVPYVVKPSDPLPRRITRWYLFRQRCEVAKLSIKYNYGRLKRKCWFMKGNFKHRCWRAKRRCTRARRALGYRSVKRRCSRLKSKLRRRPHKRAPQGSIRHQNEEKVLPASKSWMADRAAIVLQDLDNLDLDTTTSAQADAKDMSIDATDTQSGRGGTRISSDDFTKAMTTATPTDSLVSSACNTLVATSTNPTLEHSDSEKQVLKNIAAQTATQVLRTITSREDPDKLYSFIEFRGYGANGSVYSARPKNHKLGTKDVAIKRMKLHQIAKHPHMVDEINLMREIRYPNIPSIINALMPNNKDLFIVMELVDGTSLDMLLSVSKMKESHIATVCRELCGALKYLHSKAIVHRDIKLANVMVTREGQVKLIDFGVSTKLVDGPNKCTTWIGTLAYMAPEMTLNWTFDTKTDIWSLGITLFKMAKRDSRKRGVVRSVFHGIDKIFKKGHYSLHRWEASPDLRSFLSQCLYFTSSRRPSAAKLLDHVFLEQAETVDCLTPLVARGFKKHQPHKRSPCP